MVAQPFQTCNIAERDGHGFVGVGWGKAGRVRQKPNVERDDIVADFGLGWEGVLHYDERIFETPGRLQYFTRNQGPRRTYCWLWSRRGGDAAVQFPSTSPAVIAHTTPIATATKR